MRRVLELFAPIQRTEDDTDKHLHRSMLQQAYSIALQHRKPWYTTQKPSRRNNNNNNNNQTARVRSVNQIRHLLAVEVFPAAGPRPIFWDGDIDSPTKSQAEGKGKQRIWVWNVGGMHNLANRSACSSERAQDSKQGKGKPNAIEGFVNCKEAREFRKGWINASSVSSAAARTRVIRIAVHQYRTSTTPLLRHYCRSHPPRVSPYHTEICTSREAVFSSCCSRPPQLRPRKSPARAVFSRELEIIDEREKAVKIN